MAISSCCLGIHNYHVPSKSKKDLERRTCKERHFWPKSSFTQTAPGVALVTTLIILVNFCNLNFDVTQKFYFWSLEIAYKYSRWVVDFGSCLNLTLQLPSELNFWSTWMKDNKAGSPLVETSWNEQKFSRWVSTYPGATAAAPQSRLGASQPKQALCTSVPPSQ